MHRSPPFSQEPPHAEEPPYQEVSPLEDEPTHAGTREAPVAPTMLAERSTGWPVRSSPQAVPVAPAGPLAEAPQAALQDPHLRLSSVPCPGRPGWSV